MAIFTMLASLSKPVKACSSRNSHCAGLSRAAVDQAAREVGGLGVLLQDVRVKAEIRKPAVPQAGSQMRQPARGSTRSTIRSMMWRGVRNWPLVPDCGELAEQVLIHVPLDVVAIAGGEVQLVDPLHDGPERGAVIDLERGAAEEQLPGGRSGWAARAVFRWHRGRASKRLVAGQGDEVAPGVARPLAGEDPPVSGLDHGGLLVAIGEQAQEDAGRNTARWNPSGCSPRRPRAYS